MGAVFDLCIQVGLGTGFGKDLGLVFRHWEFVCNGVIKIAQNRKTCAIFDVGFG